MNSTQQSTAPTTDIEKPQIIIPLYTGFLSIWSGAPEMNTAPVVESGLISVKWPATIIVETNAIKPAAGAPI